MIEPQELISKILPLALSYLLISPIHASAEFRYRSAATPVLKVFQLAYMSFFMPLLSLALTV
nr:MAG TPA: hypothetical protein [Caudoviricetes sp.]